MCPTEQTVAKFHFNIYFKIEKLKVREKAPAQQRTYQDVDRILREAEPLAARLSIAPFQ
jgi:hypothetical protein